MMLNTQTAFFFKEQSCSDLTEILPLVPTATFFAYLMDNSATFGTLMLGTLHGNHHFSPVLG